VIFAVPEYYFPLRITGRKQGVAASEAGERFAGYFLEGRGVMKCNYSEKTELVVAEE
jgi:hypothetical protein